MLRLGIHDILHQAGLTRTVEYEEHIDFPDFDTDGPLKIELKLTNASSRIIVNGSIAGYVMLECVRCLREFPCRVDFEFYEEYLPEDSPELIDEEHLSWEDLSRFTYSDEHIDLYEMIRQNVVSALPMKPLCSDDCRGLCQDCGADLNTETCRCSRPADFSNDGEAT